MARNYLTSTQRGFDEVLVNSQITLLGNLLCSGNDPGVIISGLSRVWLFLFTLLRDLMQKTKR